MHSCSGTFAFSKILTATISPYLVSHSSLTSGSNSSSTSPGPTMFFIRTIRVGFLISSVTDVLGGGGGVWPGRRGTLNGSTPPAPGSIGTLNLSSSLPCGGPNSEPIPAGGVLLPYSSPPPPPSSVSSPTALPYSSLSPSFILLSYSSP